jgi:hypothetical protein
MKRFDMPDKGMSHLTLELETSPQSDTSELCWASLASGHIGDTTHIGQSTFDNVDLPKTIQAFL